MTEDSPADVAEWYVRSAEGERGPLSAAELKDLAARGRIARTDQVRKAGGVWRTAKSVSGLFAEPKGYDAFVSYSSRNKTMVDGLVHCLEAAGIRCWVAPRDILPGANWGEAIIRGIESCRVFLLLLSKDSNQSQQILQEVERAVAKGLTVMPVRIEDVQVSTALELYVGPRHWLDAFAPPIEAHARQLAEAVHRILGSTTTPSANMVPAAKPGKAGKPGTGATTRPSHAVWVAAALGAAIAAGGLWWGLSGDGQPVDAGGRTESHVVAKPGPQQAPESTKSSPNPRDTATAELQHRLGRQRKIVAEVLAPGLYDVLVTKPQQPARRAEVRVVSAAADGALVMTCRDREDPATYSLYRGAIVGPGGTRGDTGWIARLQLDPGLAAQMRHRGVMSGQDFALVPVDGAGAKLEGRMATGEQFVLDAARRRAPPAAPDRGPGTLRVGQRWSGRTRGRSGSSARFAATLAELDGERGYLRWHVEPEDDPWNPVVFEGSFASPPVADGWFARIEKRGAGTGPYADWALLGVDPATFHMRFDGTTCHGCAPDGAAFELTAPSDDAKRLATAELLDDVTAPGTLWKGTSRNVDGPANRITLAFTESRDNLGYLRCVVTLDQAPGLRAPFLGSARTGAADVGYWPLQLKKPHDQPFPGECALMSAWEMQLSLRPVGPDRLVGTCGSEKVDLSRSDQTLSDELLDVRGRLLDALQPGAAFAGTARWPEEPAIPLEMTVVQCEQDGAMLTMRFASKTHPAHPRDFSGGLRTEDARIDCWPIIATRKFGDGDPVRGMFGFDGGTDTVHLWLDPEGRLLGWCDRQWLELAPKPAAPDDTAAVRQNDASVDEMSAREEELLVATRLLEAGDLEEAEKALGKLERLLANGGPRGRSPRAVLLSQVRFRIAETLRARGLLLVRSSPNDAANLLRRAARKFSEVLDGDDQRTQLEGSSLHAAALRWSVEIHSRLFDGYRRLYQERKAKTDYNSANLHRSQAMAALAKLHDNYGSEQLPDGRTYESVAKVEVAEIMR